MNFLKIANDVDVLPLMAELSNHPELWDRDVERLSVNGPHRETDDIWIRYRDKTEHVAKNNWSEFADIHIPIWYPSAADLPSAVRLALDLMAHTRGEMLGGVLLYRVPAGKQIYIHTDTGWHPEYFDKYNLALQSQSGCSFYYPETGESMEAVTGDLHWFRNTVPHGVKNESDQDQIILTFCIKANANKGE